MTDISTNKLSVYLIKTVDPNNLRRIDKKNMSSVPKDTSEQLSREGVAAAFCAEGAAGVGSGYPKPRQFLEVMGSLSIRRFQLKIRDYWLK